MAAGSPPHIRFRTTAVHLNDISSRYYSFLQAHDEMALEDGEGAAIASTTAAIASTTAAIEVKNGIDELRVD